MQIGWIVSGAGIVLAFAGLFLPWVKASFVSVALPLLEGAIGALYPEIALIISQFSTYSSITGLDALLHAELIASSFRLIVALPVVYAIIALIALVILWQAGKQARVVGAVMAVAGLLVLAVLIFNIPNLTRLGYGDNWLVAAGVAMLGFSPEMGFWFSFLGVVAITAGMALCYFAEQESEQSSAASIFYS